MACSRESLNMVPNSTYWSFRTPNQCALGTYTWCMHMQYGLYTILLSTCEASACFQAIVEEEWTASQCVADFGVGGVINLEAGQQLCFLTFYKRALIKAIANSVRYPLKSPWWNDPYHGKFGDFKFYCDCCCLSANLSLKHLLTA